ncbi:MAG: putative bifunctional diguanylate cyclase/phosphodiesterase [Hyphomicrobiaceae bacterium]
MVIAQRRTIAGRLYLVCGLALAAVAALTAVSIYYASVTRRAADALYEGGLVGAVEAGELELLLEKHRRVIESAPLEFERSQIERDKKIAEEIARRTTELVTRSDGAFGDELADALLNLWRLGRDVLESAANFAQEQGLRNVEVYVGEAERLQEFIRGHRRNRVAGADREARGLATKARSLVNAVTGFALFAAILIGPFALVALRSLIMRLDGITAAMRRLARNDTDVSVEKLVGTDEIGEMARAVTVFKSNAVQVQQLNRWLDIALNNMARGLSMFDGDRRLVVCNAAYARMYALPEHLAQAGAPFADVLEHRRTLIASVETSVPRAGTAGIEAIGDLAMAKDEGRLRQRLVDGRIIEISVKPLPWGGWVALHEDVTERYEAAERIVRLARHDTLTGLANRHTFQETLEQATARIGAGETFAILAIDLDRFKEVNDTLGHPAGDALLVAVGNRLTDITRRSDLVARLGGDEFAIIQRDASCRADSEALALRVIEALQQPFQLQGHRAEIGGTVGVALAPVHGRDAGELMKHADLALYRAKGERRGTMRFYCAEMEGRIRARRALESDLGHAVANRELELHYQPIVSLASGLVIGCEALIRWRHPERGMVSPADFIPLAEETGHICEIGAWALEEACRTAASWPGDMRVAVNLSVAQFSGRDLASIAADALREAGLAPGRLELEVTETLLLGDDPATLALLHRLRDIGLSIALDDFGTGYSSLSHLRSFPFDKIKIDQTFVRDLPQRKNCEAIVGAVARLASSLSMTTVAEGVETEDHLARVRAAGCDAVQGYLFSRPVPAKDLAAAVARIEQRAKPAGQQLQVA